jgi:hypothetical protein
MSDDPGYYTQTFEAVGLDDDQLTSRCSATIEVTASFGEFEGVVLDVTRPDAPSLRYVLVEVSPKGARRLADAIADAAVAPHDSTQVPALEDEDTRAVVEVGSYPDEFTGVYLGITFPEAMECVPLRLFDDTALEVAAALVGALAYLADNGADITIGYDGENHENDEVPA